MPDGKNEDTNRTEGAVKTAQGGGADSVLQITQAELQKRIDKAVQQAIATREKNLRAEYEQKLEEKDEELRKLKEELESGSKTTEEKLEDLKKQVTKLNDELKAARKRAKDLETELDGYLEVELTEIGDEGRALFEEICPDGLSTGEKLDFLAKMKAKGILAPKTKEEEGKEEKPAESEQGAEGSAIPQHEGAIPGGVETGELGKRIAEEKRKQEAGATQGAIDPWANIGGE